MPDARLSVERTVMRNSVVLGSVAQAALRNGWFVGHFVDNEGDLRATEALEVKWGVHLPGEGRASWAETASAVTLTLLIRGRLRLSFSNGQEVLLTHEGEYAVWPPQIAHTWFAEEHAIVLTIRWPSIAG